MALPKTTFPVVRKSVVTRRKTRGRAESFGLGAIVFLFRLVPHVDAHPLGAAVASSGSGPLL